MGVGGVGSRNQVAVEWSIKSGRSKVRDPSKTLGDGSTVLLQGSDKASSEQNFAPGTGRWCGVGDW